MSIFNTRPSLRTDAETFVTTQGHDWDASGSETSEYILAPDDGSDSHSRGTIISVADDSEHEDSHPDESLAAFGRLRSADRYSTWLRDEYSISEIPNSVIVTSGCSYVVDGCRG